MAKKQEKKVVEVKGVEFDVFGFVAESETYTSKVFKEKKTPKKNHYTVDLEPMSDPDCVTINTLNRQESIQMSLWFAENQKHVDANNKWIASLDDNTIEVTSEDYILISEITQKREEFKKNSEKFAVVQKYISNLSAPHPLAGEGVISDKAWETIPAIIKADYYNRIYDISNMNEVDAINLQ